MNERVVHVLGGGTLAHVRPHLALAAPAYGSTAREITRLVGERAGLFGGARVELHLTKMAGGDLETNADVARRLAAIGDDPMSKAVFLSAALCDFEGSVEGVPGDKRAPRLRSDRGYALELRPAEKVIAGVRRERKDIFLVGFKTTVGAREDAQFEAGLGLLVRSSCNLVLANDLATRVNLVVTPERARYHVTRDRAEALAGLVEMAGLRSGGTFTRSTVVPGEPVAWSDGAVYPALRRVVDHCVARGAYKTFLGSTVGHFAARLDGGSFLTSRRKTDFNRLDEFGLVRVETEGDARVVAHGSRPSVGGQSQRLVFADHPGTDCIVHFHCPARPGSRVARHEQRPFECGSHECGENTSRGLRYESDAGLFAVYLERHGPNLVFSRHADPARVIGFIEENFDLARATSEGV